jgi:2-methylisocitrate lyase-like PEP mutase family enzyme
VSELTEDNRGPGRLRQLLAGHEPVVAPGAYDALSARLVEHAGFDAVYMTGFGASAALLGRPDVGLLSFAEMVDQARRLVAAVEVPLIADADDGYGNPVNVMRTVREYEAAGVAGLHLEDQLSPKRCGHLEGKQLIAASEMVEKIHAAVEARRSEDLVVIARTDARAVEGLDAALERARRYREAGADVLFVEAPQSEAEVAAVAEAFPDVPLLFNAVEGGRTPPLELGRGRPHAAARARAPARPGLPSHPLPADRAPRGHRRRPAGTVATAEQRDPHRRRRADLLGLHGHRRAGGDPAARGALRGRARALTSGGRRGYSLPSSGELAQFSTSLDGGALWSTVATLAVTSDANNSVQLATLPSAQRGGLPESRWLSRH